MFQWGHDITVVETVISIIKGYPSSLVSMGPRHYSRGNARIHLGHELGSFVSMGPRHYSRGNLQFRMQKI